VHLRVWPILGQLSRSGRYATEEAIADLAVVAHEAGQVCRAKLAILKHVHGGTVSGGNGCLDRLREAQFAAIAQIEVRSDGRAPGALRDSDSKRRLGVTRHPRAKLGALARFAQRPRK